jgi:hypothetical protein
MILKYYLTNNILQTKMDSERINFLKKKEENYNFNKNLPEKIIFKYYACYNYITHLIKKHKLYEPKIYYLSCLIARNMIEKIKIKNKDLVIISFISIKIALSLESDYLPTSFRKDMSKYKYQNYELKILEMLNYQYNFVTPEDYMIKYYPFDCLFMNIIGSILSDIDLMDNTSYDLSIVISSIMTGSDPIDQIRLKNKILEKMNNRYNHYHEKIKLKKDLWFKFNDEITIYIEKNNLNCYEHLFINMNYRNLDVIIKLNKFNPILKTIRNFFICEI